MIITSNIAVSFLIRNGNPSVSSSIKLTLVLHARHGFKPLSIVFDADHEFRSLHPVERRSARASFEHALLAQIELLKKLHARIRKQRNPIARCVLRLREVRRRDKTVAVAENVAARGEIHFSMRHGDGIRSQLERVGLDVLSGKTPPQRIAGFARVHADPITKNSRSPSSTTRILYS